MVSEICVPQSLSQICAKFDKFLVHGQTHMEQMAKWPWQCTTTGLEYYTELETVKIRQSVTEIWIPQDWQPPARPDRDDNIPPARIAEGWNIFWFKYHQTLFLRIQLPICQNWSGKVLTLNRRQTITVPILTKIYDAICHHCATKVLVKYL